MIQNKTILVAGGDLRQMSLAKLFDKNNKVFCVGLEQGSGISHLKTTVDELIMKNVAFDYIILPMPASLDNNTINCPFSSKNLLIDDVLCLADEKTAVYGGKLSLNMKQHLEEKKLWYLDYLDREELAVLNAVPTAEGTIQILMEELPTTVYGTRCLLIGNGRITKVLTPRLIAMGAKVTVSARKYSDYAWIEIAGAKAISTHDIASHILNQDVVINTVPAMVLNEEILSKVDENCLLIDLASKPGGIDFTIAREMGLKTIWALSLPGKVAPVSAGKIIYETIQNVEAERRIHLD
ncbi:dipicolinate synthase subunit DpsA [Paludicola sp. MB14-C6]|uniref:dipicolinate synthase subunit DpsA n=1 Tax=Paludihabitans sp. MB14-C6 TaxID=3070656 RepID=UPI0027DBEB0A|nr:dipicolinate synthase subunit DpsA [Paludicola sp. MB14-C6]WMJ24222.1 dipicolinate synthase subunit DpsA [Paludicola sp. MB14-C6]